MSRPSGPKPAPAVPLHDQFRHQLYFLKISTLTALGGWRSECQCSYLLNQPRVPLTRTNVERITRLAVALNYFGPIFAQPVEPITNVPITNAPGTEVAR